MKLAFNLGYKSSMVIDKWIERDAVPVREVDRVLKIVESKKEGK